MALSGAWNFRDVAEETALRPGRFFRSSQLSDLSDEGRRRFVDLGITDVADLRSPQEVQRQGPGLVPDGVAVHLLPFPDVAVTDEDAPHEVTFQAMLRDRPAEEDIAAAARRFMVAEYLRFPTLGGAQRAVRRVITLLADQRPVITHCFAGKDRTGFTVAVVLDAVGVPADVIMADFLRSNAAVPTLRARLVEAIQRRAGQAATAEAVAFAEAQLTDEVLGVREEYLDAAHRSLTQHYGSVNGYLQAAGVTDDDVARLRAALAG